MPLQKLQFKPGLNRDQTNYANEGGWYECDKIRFLSGQPQKIGGWLKYITTQLSGICRQMFNYITSYSDNLLFLGTSQKVYVEAGGTVHDITPYRKAFYSPDTDNCFTTGSAGSTTITVTINGHGGVNGDTVYFLFATGFDGIPSTDLAGAFIISNVTTNTFTITVNTPCTAGGVTGGGTSILATFEINIGNDISISGYGWGVGYYGNGTYGTARVTPYVQQQRDWFFDNFDNDVVMNIRNGALYYWQYDPLLTNHATLLSDGIPGTVAYDVPGETVQVLVSQGDKHILALGATPYGGGDFDPLLIRWSSQNDAFFWTPGNVTTPAGDLSSAGFLRLPNGSRIICGLRTRQETLVWTTSSLYSLQYIGQIDNIFQQQELADNISIASPRAKITVNNITYWMGIDKFYVYSGRVDTLPCTLRTHVFQNINFDQSDQIICGTNEGWNEVWWFYPSKNSLVNDSYVIYNHSEKIWYYGTINRTAWLDSPLRQYPQAVNQDGYIYNHEDGVDDDVLPMTSYITSSDVDIGDGDQFMLIKRIIPDVQFQGSTIDDPIVYMTVKPRNYNGSSYSTEPDEPVQQTGSVPVETYTEQVFLRARARQMGFKYLSTGLGVQWQLGYPRVDGRPDGRR
jgi:hypothetical protein